MHRRVRPFRARRSRARRRAISPNTPRLFIHGFGCVTRLPDPRFRLDSVMGRCERRHFQKKALISGTLDPPADVFQRFVVDGHHRRTDERLAGQIGELDLYLGFLARLVGRGRGADVQVENPLFRRHDDLARFRQTLPCGDRHGLDEEIGHVLLADLDFLDRAACRSCAESSGAR